MISELQNIENEISSLMLSIEQHESNSATTVNLLLAAPIAITVCFTFLVYVVNHAFIPFWTNQEYGAFAIAIFACVFFCFAIGMGFYCLRLYWIKHQNDKVESKVLYSKLAELNKEKERLTALYHLKPLS